MNKINDFKKARERRNFLERKLNLRIDSIGKALVDDESKVHCENLVGAVTIPLGVAGPVNVKGEFCRGEFHIPLATTEGALVASVSRGVKAINLSGGAIVRIEEVGTTRGPVFQTSGIEEGLKLKNWIDKNFSSLFSTAEKTSSHLKLIKADTQIVGDLVFIRFYFDTENAMGMNMVTIATEKIAELIENKLKIKCMSFAGNFDIDKKSAWLNFIKGRGKKVWAEVILSPKSVSQILKTTSEKIFRVWLSKCLIGSAMSGSLGYNSHFANIVAAFFAATGQDLAHTVEGSLGMTTTNVLEDGALYISVYLPAVMIGTVGGGTNLKTQTEARSIVGVRNSSELAEVLTVAVLAGEISLLASLAQGSLAKAHNKLGR